MYKRHTKKSAKLIVFKWKLVIKKKSDKCVYFSGPSFRTGVSAYVAIKMTTDVAHPGCRLLICHLHWWGT